jgi:hypothetical protein
MELGPLRELAPDDQWTFVRGRIVETSVALDAALRGLHAQLRGLYSVEALLDVAQNWTQAVGECREMTARHHFEEALLRTAIIRAIDEAVAAYERRNRYMHDLLTKDVDEELLPDPSMIVEYDGMFLLRLSRKEGAPNVASVTCSAAVETTRALVAATWKLRAARGYLAGQTRWRTALLGELEGGWGAEVVVRRRYAKCSRRVRVPPGASLTF